MENKSHVIVAISFLVALTLGAALFFFWLSHHKQASQVYKIVTSQPVSGLHKQTAVKFKGLRAGKVRSVAFDPQNPNKVKIIFGVYKKIPMTTSTYAKLSTAGLTGMKTLNLSNPDPKAKPLHTTKDHPTQIPLHPSLLAQLKKSGEQDMKKVNRILNNLHQVLERNNGRHLSRTIAQVNQATGKLLKAEKSVMPALKQMPQLAQETRSNLHAAKHLMTQVKKLASQAKGPVKHANKVEHSVESLSQSANLLTRRLNDQTLPHMNRLTRSINRAADHLDRLAKELQAKPQSVLVGPPKARPGPGEPGFQNAHKGQPQ